MPRFKMMFARFPGNNAEHPGSSGFGMEWVHRWTAEFKLQVVPFRESDTPIPMVRNLAVRRAIEQECDYLLMIDSDMLPDPKGPETGTLLYPGAKLFFPTAFNFLRELGQPAMVGAPYCGPSPHNNIYVFTWGNRNNKKRIGEKIGFSLDQYNRHEASLLTGVQECAALPTGLILYDVRIFQGMPKPHFYYEYTDEWQSAKASTEDVAQTRDASLAWYASGGKTGGRCFCAWDCWAHHYKGEEVGKPELMVAGEVGKHLRHVLQHNPESQDEKLVHVGSRKNGVYDHVTEKNVITRTNNKKTVGAEHDAPAGYGDNGTNDAKAVDKVVTVG